MPPPVPNLARIGGIGRMALVLLALHVLLGIARVPTIVIGRRCNAIADLQQRGPARYFLDTPHQHGAEVVEWIRGNVPEGAVVLFRGDSKGSIEFVPGMIAPRLLVAESHVPADATTWGGRALATRQQDGGRRIVVVAALGNDLRLEAR